MAHMTISAKLRLSTVTGKKGSIYIQLIKDRITKTVTTPYRVYPEEWNTSLSAIRLGSFSPKREFELREIVFSLDKEIENLKKKIKKKERIGGCSLEEAAELYRNKYSVLSFSDFVETLSTEMIRPQQSRLAEAYRSASNNLKAFNNGKDLPLEAIDSALMQAYEVYMKNKGNEPNTISFYNRNTRAIYNKAVKRGLIEKKEEDPFADVFKGVAKTRKRAVKQEIIDVLKKLDLEDITTGMMNSAGTVENETKNLKSLRKSLKFAKDIFLLSFYLRGISFVDLAYLRKSDLSGDLIIYTRHKTGQRLEVAITPSIREIIQKYARYCQNSEFLFPVLPPGTTRKDYLNALKRQNKHLKTISTMIGLETPLTTYVSRHSWASIARAKGYPIAVISQGLGHESERTTQIYLDSFDYSILHKANRKITEFSKKAPQVNNSYQDYNYF